MRWICLAYYEHEATPRKSPPFETKKEAETWGWARIWNSDFCYDFEVKEIK